MSDLPLSALLPGWHTALTVAALAIGLASAVAGALALRRARRLSDHYRRLMTGVDGEDLAAALDAFAVRLADGERRIGGLEAQVRDVDTARVAALEARDAALDGRLRRAVQRVGLHRYSAFGDAGGDQSFALALLDDAGDGVVLSGITSRTGARVYAKPVADGGSSYTLSAEEERVIAAAGEDWSSGDA